MPVPVQLARGRAPPPHLLREDQAARGDRAEAVRNAGDGGRAAAGGRAAHHDAVRAGLACVPEFRIGAGAEDGPRREERAARELPVRAGRGGADRGQREPRGDSAALRAASQARRGAERV